MAMTGKDIKLFVQDIPDEATIEIDPTGDNDWSELEPDNIRYTVLASDIATPEEES